jgi:hypothetical protein
MQSFPERLGAPLLLLAASILALAVIVFTPVAAQDSSTLTVSPLAANTIIVIEGPVAAININIITIYNFQVMVAADNPILTVVKIGDVVHVEGEADEMGVIAASVVTVVSATVTVNGPVTAINGSTLVVNNINVQFEPDDPALTLIKIGDILNVEGNFTGNGTTLILIVVNITIVNDTTVIITNLPANCKISKNGHIKCSKKHH